MIARLDFQLPSSAPPPPSSSPATATAAYLLIAMPAGLAPDPTSGIDSQTPPLPGFDSIDQSGVPSQPPSIALRPQLRVCFLLLAALLCLLYTTLFALLCSLLWRARSGHQPSEHQQSVPSPSARSNTVDDCLPAGSPHPTATAAKTATPPPESAEPIPALPPHPPHPITGGSGVPASTTTHHASTASPLTQGSCRTQAAA